VRPDPLHQIALAAPERGDLLAGRFDRDRRLLARGADLIERAMIDEQAAAAAALALTAGATLATAPASAAPANLSMTSEIRMTPVDSSRTEGGYFNEQVIYIAGVVSMSKAAAQDTINHNENTIALRYWGDDTNDDDILFGPVSPTTLFAENDGLHFERAATLSHLQLDEDSGTFENIGDGGLDEIYVGARFVDRNGNTISKVESNRITGDL